MNPPCQSGLLNQEQTPCRGEQTPSKRANLRGQQTTLLNEAVLENHMVGVTAMAKHFFRLIFPNAEPILIKSPRIGENKNLVLLLGWGGAKRKNLSKIVNVYKTLNVPVIVHIMPLGVPSFVRNHFERQLGEMINLEGSDARLLVHSYSNNGIWVFGSLLQKKLIPVPAAIVVDSAPYFFFERQSLAQEVHLLGKVALSAALGKAVYFDKMLTPIIEACLTLFIVATRALNNISVPIFPDLIKTNIYLRDHFPSIPSLFIYSLGDELVPQEKIKSFLSEIRSRGSNPIEHVFGDDVAHTASSFTHTEVYFGLVKSIFSI